LQREGNASTRGKEFTERMLALSYSVSVIQRARNRLKSFFLLVLKWTPSPERERVRSPEARRTMEKLFWVKHTFAWIFPGCTGLLFYGSDALGLANHFLVPKGLVVRRGSHFPVPQR